MERSVLILKTFDGTLRKMTVNPKSLESRVEFQIRIYNGEYRQESAVLLFTQVAAINCSMNFFDEHSGSELGGFYEIFDPSEKRERIERNFVERREGYLFHGDYSYDSDDVYELLNNRRAICEIYKRLEKYRLYQLQTTGGIYYILAGDYQLISK